MPGSYGVGGTIMAGGKKRQLRKKGGNQMALKEGNNHIHNHMRNFYLAVYL